MFTRHMGLTCTAVGWLVAMNAMAASPQAAYSQISTDTVINNGGTTLLTQTINLTSAQSVFVQTDGRVIPSGRGGAIAVVWIQIDGALVGNQSVVDWSKSTDSQQHSYNAIAAKTLAAGSHTITLNAATLNTSSFTIGARSNLATLLSPGKTIIQHKRGSDSGVLSYNTTGLSSESPLPHAEQVTNTVSGAAGSTVVVLASSRIYQYGNPGDPMTTISLDGLTQPNNVANWSDNDMNSGAENQAPFFTHALITGLNSKAHAVSLDTSAEPYAPGTKANVVQYKIAGDATLITLQGMSIVGSVPLSNDPYNVANYLAVASSTGYPGFPVAGTAVPIAQGDIVIPAGDNGVVFIAGKTRVQGGTTDSGTVLLYLTIDGVQQGSLGAQQLANPNGVSTRTISASYLATGTQALSTGTHHVVLYAQGNGTFKTLCVTADLPLIWFN
jgi:hypothetical protein